MATILYAYPVSGTTAPALGWGGNLVTGTCIFSDADTTLAITHGFGLLTSELASLFPLVLFNWNATNSGSDAGGVLVALTNSNVITLSKTSAVGSGGTGVVAILRPMSTIR